MKRCGPPNNKVCVWFSIIGKEYVMHEPYADLMPTYFWPSGNIVKLKLTLSGDGVCAFSVTGVAVAQVVDAGAVLISSYFMLSKESDLHPLGGTFDRYLRVGILFLNILPLNSSFVC